MSMSELLDGIDTRRAALLLASMVALGLGAVGAVVTIMLMALWAAGVLGGGILIMGILSPFLLMFSLMATSGYWYLTAPVE